MAAKKSVKVKRAAKQQLFYVSKDKLDRAKILAGKNKKAVKTEYERLGGLFAEGQGLEPVK